MRRFLMTMFSYVYTLTMCIAVLCGLCGAWIRWKGSKVCIRYENEGFIIFLLRFHTLTEYHHIRDDCSCWLHCWQSFQEPHPLYNTNRCVSSPIKETFFIGDNVFFYFRWLHRNHHFSHNFRICGRCYSQYFRFHYYNCGVFYGQKQTTGEFVNILLLFH